MVVVSLVLLPCRMRVLLDMPTARQRLLSLALLLREGDGYGKQVLTRYAAGSSLYPFRSAFRTPA